MKVPVEEIDELARRVVEGAMARHKIEKDEWFRHNLTTIVETSITVGYKAGYKEGKKEWKKL